MRTPFPYVGGKANIAKRMLPYLAVEQPVYVEPFFGAGGVFFAKPPASTEYINDLNGDVVNFFRVLRDHPDELIHLCQLTPYARDEYFRCRDEEWPDLETHDGRIEAARRLFVLARQGRVTPNRAEEHRGAPGWQSRSTFASVSLQPTEIGGWRSPQRDTRPKSNPATGQADLCGWKSSEKGNPNNNSATATAATSSVLHQIAERLRRVTIDNRDAVKVIQRYDCDSAFLYLDPPYLFSTRRPNLYKCEMQDDDHLKLLECVKQCKGKVAISGYPSDFYDEVLVGWERVELSTVQFIQGGEQLSPRTEVLWMNYTKSPRLF